MNSMGNQWVVMGAFKLKEWYIATGVAEVSLVCHTPCDYNQDVDALTLPEILNIIAEHRCPITYG